MISFLKIKDLNPQIIKNIVFYLLKLETNILFLNYIGFDKVSWSNFTMEIFVKELN